MLKMESRPVLDPTHITSQNRLFYNAAVGVLGSEGETAPLSLFLQNMKDKYVNSFLGSTLTVHKLDKPLLVYRAGEMGKFWTTTPPASAWQHSFELAMHRNVYFENAEHMLYKPNWHPTNRGVLVYEIPANEIVAIGKAAPQGGWTGMGTQIYIEHVPEHKVQKYSWGQFKQTVYPTITNSPEIRVPYNMRLYYNGREVLRNTGRTLGTIAIPLSWIMEMNAAYAIDPNRDVGRAVVVGTSNTVMKGSIFTGLAIISGPAAVVLGAATVTANMPPERIEAEINKQLDINRQLREAGISSPYADEYMLLYASAPYVKKFWNKIESYSADIGDSQQGRAVAKIIKPIANFFIEAGRAVTFSGFPAYRPHQEQKRQPSLQTSTSSSIQLPNQTSAMQPLDNFFNVIDPNPAQQPVSPDVFALTAFPNNYQSMHDLPNNQNNFPIARSTHTAENSNERTVVRQDYQLDITAPPSTANVNVEAQTRRIMTSYPSLYRAGTTHHNTAQDRPVLSNYRIGAYAGGIGVYATLYSSGTVGIAYIQGGVAVMNTVYFGPGFWAAMGTGLGIGLALAAPIVAFQYFHNRNLKIALHKTKQSLKHAQQDHNNFDAQCRDLQQKLDNDDKPNVDNLLHQVKSLIDLVKKNIAKQIDRADKARDRDHKKASRAHISLLSNDYQPKLKQLLSLQEKLHLEEIRQATIAQHEGKSPAELLQELKTLVNKGKLTTEEVVRVETLRQLFVGKTNILSINGDKETASLLMQEANRLSYYKQGTIQGFSFSNETDNHKSLNHYRGMMRKELNDHSNNINDAIGRGENPVESINNLLRFVEDKIKHYQKHHDKPIENDLIAFKNQLVSIRDHYQQYGNQASNLSLNELTSLFVQFHTQEEKDSTFWYAEFNQINEKGSPTFIPLTTDEAKKCALEMTRSMLTNAVFSEVISQAATGEYSTSEENLSHLEKTIPDTSTHVKDLKGVVQFYRDNHDKPAEFYLETLTDFDSCQNSKGEVKHALSQQINTDSPLVREAIAHKTRIVVTGDALRKVASGNYVEAETAIQKLTTLVPDSADSNNKLLTIIRLGIKDGKNTEKKSADFWLNELQISKKTEKADSALVGSFEYLAEEATVDEVIEKAGTGEYKAAKDKLDKLEVEVSSAKDAVKELRDIFSNAENQSNSDEEYWFNYHKQSKSESVSRSSVVKRNIASYEEQKIAGNKEKLGFNYHSATTLKRLAELEPNLQLENTITKLELQDQTQVNAAFAKPIQAILDRSIRGLPNSNWKTAASVGMQALQTAQLVMPNFAGLLAQGTQHLYQGTFAMFTPYAMKTAETTLTNIRADKTVFALQLAVHASQWSLESIPGLLKMPLSKDWAATIRKIRTTTIMIGQPIVKAYFLYHAIKDLRNARQAVSSTLPLSIATLSQTVMDSVNWLHEKYQSLKGNLNETPAYYRDQIFYSTLLDSLSSVFHMAGLRNFTSWLTGGMTAFSAANLAHSAIARNSHQQGGIKALYACITNLNHYDAIKKGEATSYYVASAISTYLNGVEYSFVFSEPSDENLQQVELGTLILFSQTDDGIHGYVKKKYAGIQKISLEELPDTKDAKFTAFMHKLVASVYEQESIIQMGYILTQEFGHTYQDSDEDIINHARLVYYISQIDNEIQKKDLAAILELTSFDEVNQKPRLGKLYQLPLYMAVNAILKRLAAIATHPSTMPSFHREYIRYLNALYENSPEDWRKDNWQKCVEGFKEICVVALKNVLILAQHEPNLDSKKALLSVVLQDYFHCGDWHQLLDNDYKLLAAYCFYQIERFDLCTDFIANITDISALLEKQKSPEVTSAALFGLYNSDRAKYHHLLLANDRSKFAITDEVLQNEASRLLKENKYLELITWLTNYNDFKNRSYYLASAYLESGIKENLFYAFEAAFAESNKDLNYWLLCHNLFCQLFDELRSHDIDYDVMKRTLSMFKVCCDMLLTFELSSEDIKDFREKSLQTHEQLMNLIRSYRSLVSTVFFSRNVESQAEHIHLKTRQILIGANQNKRQEELRLIFATLNLLPKAEKERVVCVDNAVTETRRVLSN